MISQWIRALDKKSSERTESEIDEIFKNLNNYRIFQRLHPLVLRDLCRHACIEFLDKAVFLFKQGDEALHWYAIISGSLDIQISQTGRLKDTVTLCTLGIGTACDDSVLNGKTHSVSVVTNEKCTLIRVKRETFCGLWEKNLQLIENNAMSPVDNLNYSFSASLPSKLPIRSYSKSFSSISGRQSTSPDNSRSNSRSNMLAVDIREANSDIITAGSSRNSFSSLNTDTHLLVEHKARHLSEGQIDKLDQSTNRDQLNPLFQNQSSSSANLKSSTNSAFNQSISNLEQSNQPINQIFESKQDAFSRRKSFRRSTLRKSSHRTVCSTGYEESDLNATVLRVAKVLRILIQFKAPYLIRDRCLESPLNYETDANNNKDYSSSFTPPQREIYANCMVGSEMVDWLLSISANTTLRLHSRFQASAMFQVLMEENVLKMVPNRLAYESGNQRFFEDKYVFYRFCFDCDAQYEDNLQADQQTVENTNFQINETNSISIEKAEAETLHCLQLLSKLSPGAMFRKILQKRPEERTADEIDLVYMQLMHIKPLSSLSNTIRQELARVVQYEQHRKAQSIVFNQGEQGISWYIILKGSVNVVILGKGVVCTLNDGDDFGKLAVINETARAATIITNEDNCQFLKVSKFHFDKIMRDAEANTVRLKEHGNEVLVLQKMATRSDDDLDNDGQVRTSFKYMVMAGQPDKIIEYLIETRIDVNQDSDCLLNNCLVDRNNELLMSKGSLLYNIFDSSLTSSDTFLEDFLLTYQIYLSNFTLCKFLLKYYKIDHSTTVNNNSSKTNSSSTSKSTSPSNASIPANKTATEFMLLNKRKVIRFIKIWLQVAKEPFFCDNHIINFLNEINKLLEDDSIKYQPQLNEEVLLFNQILECKQTYDDEMESRGIKKWKSDVPGPIRRLSDVNGVTCNLINTKTTKTKATIPPTLTRTNSLINRNIFSSFTSMNNRNSIAALTNTITSPFNAIASNPAQQQQNAQPNASTSESEFFMINRRLNVIRAKDEMISRVYCADHTYTTLKLPVDSTAQVIKMQAVEKLGLANKASTSNENSQTKSDEFILVEIKSNGERILFKDAEVSIQAGLSVNGRLFISSLNHLDALTPLPEQSGPSTSSFHIIEEFTEVQLAFYLTYYSFSLYSNVHEYELIHQVFGRHNFGQITANLDVFLKHFNEVQYWVVTELILQNNLAKRVHLLKKFIKVASICKDYHNLNTFFAIIMGLNNIAVSRLTQTWDKLSSKLKRLLSQFESLIDPSRNHRKYRMYLSNLAEKKARSSAIIPFTPLLLKDMTFAHEGNLTFIGKGMINFEKMHMVAQTLRVFKYCKSKPLSLENITLTNVNQSTTLTPQFKSSLLKIDSYIRDLKVIDNQKVLNQLSHRIEHRK